MRSVEPRLLAAALLLVAAAAHADDVVLVTNANNEILSLSSLQMRELYLGHRVQVGNQRLRGVRVAGDARLEQVFLQYVVAMSADAYDRRLLALSIQRGRLPPARVSTERALLEAVRSNASLIGYCWRSAVANDPDLRVLRVIWRE